MNPADLRPQVEAMVRALGAGDYASAVVEMDRIRASLPSQSLTVEDELRMAEAVLARAYATGKAHEVKAARALFEEVSRRAEAERDKRPKAVRVIEAPADPERADALAKLRASAQVKGGRLAPAWSQVAAETGIPRTTLQRWWAAAEAQPEGEVIERAATVVQGEVEQSMREWIRGPMMRWRKMVDAVTSDKTVASVQALAADDPEAAARTVVLVSKILESAPVIARLGDDEGPRGGTTLLDRVRAQLESMSDGRALLAAK